MSKYKVLPVDENVVAAYKGLLAEDIGKAALVNEEKKSLVDVFDTEEEAVEAEAFLEMFGKE